MDAGWSLDNIAFGSGGGLLQDLNRDTVGGAFKCNYLETDTGGVDVYKDPITDPGKTSLKGLLAVGLDSEGKYRAVECDSVEEQYWSGCMLDTVMTNGVVRHNANNYFQMIRNRAQGLV